jgi:VIT1/CCC1 family predicted Fe2+/Mn2+ transporter
MGVRGERRLAVFAVRAIGNAESPAAGRAIVADNLPPIFLPALTESDLERIRLHLGALPPEGLETRFSRNDYLAALSVFLLVFLCLFPVAAPFLVVDNVAIALRLSNAVAVGMLFLTGIAFGRQVGRPYRTGFLMVAIGIALVGIAMVFGG